MTTKENVVKRSWKPLESRKVRVALATVIAAFAANWGLKVDEELVLTILGVGVSLILGIAHEDAGCKCQIQYSNSEEKTEPRP